MNSITGWKCPKCGTMNAVIHDTDLQTSRSIEFCDTEGGGCDEMFVIETARTVEVVAVMSTKVEYAK